LLLLCAAFLLGSTPTVASGQQAPAYQDEFIGPFSSWANVKTVYHAAGDGITDDTAALQSALNDVGNSGKPDVIYLPAGAYKITSTLYLSNRRNISVVGESPSTTTIKWAGASGGTMFWADGVAFSKWSRITWDGSNTAAVAFAHRWNTAHPMAAVSLRHEDEVFQNAQRCLVGGSMAAGYDNNDSEVSVVRAVFKNCTDAGLSTESWNALDYWVWDSQFINNGRGVTNQYGAGNFNVYRSLFQNSSVADISICSKSSFVFRGNVSSGSNQFLYQCNLGQNATQLTVQQNRILDTKNPIAIDVGSLGPLVLIDNQIRSASGAVGPAVRLSTWASGGDLLSLGNQYTVANPISVSTGGTPRWWTQDDQIVAYSNISSTLPSLPGVSPNLKRTVFEVPAGASGSTIQTSINQAATLCGQRPVVHLAKGTYSVSQTLTVPACDMQIIGDGWGTTLNWTGTSGGTTLDLAGPSKVILKEIGFNGPSTAVVVENADQPGARVYADELQPELCGQYCVLADGLTYTRTELHGTNGSTTNGVVLKSIGANGAGNSVLAQYGGMNGMEINAQTLYSVANGGRMLIEDAWYEGHGSRGINLSNDSGSFTWWSGIFAPYSDAAATPGFSVNNFTGPVLLGNVTADLTMSSAYRPFTIGTENSGTNVLLAGNDPNQANFFNRTSSGGKASYLNNKLFGASTGDLQDADKGDARTSAAISNAFALLRSTAPQYTGDLPAGTTDVRLLRVLMLYPNIALRVKAGAVAPAAPPTLTSVSPLPPATVNQAYSYTFTATGATPMTWSVISGTLPAGLSLNSTSGVLSGTATVAGTSTFTVQASDSSGSASGQYSLTVNGTAPTIKSQSPLPAGTTGTAYSYQFTASGSTPMTWTVIGGTLPGGLTLSSSGLLSGSPTQSGTYSFTIQASNSYGANSAAFSLTCNGGVAPTITSTSSALGAATLNQPYSYQFTAAGTAPMTWRVASGSLPPGLTLSSSGLLSGSPTQGGTYSFTVQASNSYGANSAAFSLTCSGGVAPTITSRSSALGQTTLNQPYSYQFTATGTTPMTWTVISGTLPPGLTLSSSGLLSGAATQRGNYSFVVQVTNAAGSATVLFKLKVR
jgi:hypothetical protein